MTTVTSAGTNFTLGQRLWPIQRPMTEWKVNPPFDFLYLMWRDHDVLYGFTWQYGFQSCDVFASEAEAKEECARRNAPPKDS